jgi:hypothetical protein
VTSETAPAPRPDVTRAQAILDATGQLPMIPRPDGSFPYSSPDLRRPRVGRHRVLYEIREDAIAIRLSPAGAYRRHAGMPHTAGPPAPVRLAMEPSQDTAIPDKSRSYIRLMRVGPYRAGMLLALCQIGMICVDPRVVDMMLA